MQADVVIASTLPVDLMSSDAWKRERTAGRNVPSEDRWKLSVSEISAWLETREGETSLRLTTRLTSSYLVLLVLPVGIDGQVAKNRPETDSNLAEAWHGTL